MEYMKRYRKGLAKHYIALDSPKELERLRGLARDMFGTGMTSGGIKTLLDLLG